MGSFDTKVTREERERVVVPRLKSREKLLNVWRVTVEDKRYVQSFPSGGGGVRV